MVRMILPVLAIPFLLGAVHEASARQLKVGDRAPAWTLPNMLGKKVSSESYANRPAVLVIGTAREAAPPCREWTLTLHRNAKGTDTVVYQVVVLNNPWYIPEFAVIDELEGFIPKFGHPLVLLEWELAWGKLYGIPYDFEPRIMVIDKKGIIRLRHTGKMTDEALVTVLTTLDEINQ